jgi:hypothetical protein
MQEEAPRNHATHSMTAWRGRRGSFDTLGALFSLPDTAEWTAPLEASRCSPGLHGIRQLEAVIRHRSSMVQEQKQEGVEQLACATCRQPAKLQCPRW